MKLNDLNFEEHPIDMGGMRAEHTFPNGYGVSVITGPMFYTSEDRPYEVAIIKDGRVTYNTPITDDVLGWQTAANVEDVMNRLEKM